MPVSPVVDRRGFSTAHAVLGQTHGRVVASEDPEAVVEATVGNLDEERWCTDSQEVREGPSQKS